MKKTTSKEVEKCDKKSNLTLFLFFTFDFA